MCRMSEIYAASIATVCEEGVRLSSPAAIRSQRDAIGTSLPALTMTDCRDNGRVVRCRGDGGDE